MKIHPVLTQQNGIVSVQLQAEFVGEPTDANDKALIQAFGDPKVNLAGQFTDPNDQTFVFTFPTSELYAGVTTALATFTARFMTALPSAFIPGQEPPCAGPLDCIINSPARAAQLWVAAINTRIQAAFTTLRQQTVISALSDFDV